MNQSYARLNAPYATITRTCISFVQLHLEHFALGCLSRVLCILNSDWLRHARSVRGEYVYLLISISGTPISRPCPNILRAQHPDLRCQTYIHQEDILAAQRLAKNTRAVNVCRKKVDLIPESSLWLKYSIKWRTWFGRPSCVITSCHGLALSEVNKLKTCESFEHAS